MCPLFDMGALGKGFSQEYISGSVDMVKELRSIA